MEKYVKRLPSLLVLTGIFICSCTPKNPKKPPPAILEGKKIDVSSIYKKRGQDLVEALYEELVSNSAELVQLEKQIKALQEQWPDSLDVFKKYHEKNATYYDAAIKKAGAISDSILREKIIQTIIASRQQYSDSIVVHTQLDSLLRKKSATINDLHILLKLAKTLPVIKEFEETNRPPADPAANMNRQMEEFIQRLDSMVLQAQRVKDSTMR